MSTDSKLIERGLSAYDELKKSMVNTGEKWVKLTDEKNLRDLLESLTGVEDVDRDEVGSNPEVARKVVSFAMQSKVIQRLKPIPSKTNGIQFASGFKLASDSGFGSKMKNTNEDGEETIVLNEDKDVQEGDYDDVDDDDVDE